MTRMHVKNLIVICQATAVYGRRGIHPSVVIIKLQHNLCALCDCVTDSSFQAFA